MPSLSQRDPLHRSRNLNAAAKYCFSAVGCIFRTVKVHKIRKQFVLITFQSTIFRKMVYFYPGDMLFSRLQVLGICIFSFYLGRISLFYSSTPASMPKAVYSRQSHQRDTARWCARYNWVPPAGCSAALHRSREIGSADRFDKGFHSEYGQDEWTFHQFFSNFSEPEGFFVEFGARDGIDHSNSYFFETRLGWQGILVEPVHSEYLKLSTHRPKSKALHGALCVREGSETFVSLDGELMGWSGFESVLRIKGHWDHINSVVASGRASMTKVQVQCYNLNSELRKLGKSRVHFLSADCEGCEIDVLRHLNWDEIFIDVVLRERHNNAEIESREASFMYANGFVLVEWDTSDMVFVNKRSPYFPNDLRSLS